MGIKYAVLKIAVGAMRVIYAPMKLQRTKKKVVIVSRQSNKPSMDIRLIERYLKENYPDIECVVLCRYLDDVNPVAYLGEVLKQMKHMASGRVILIDGYCIAASILKHQKNTSVVQMWHALAAIKKFGYETIGKPSGHSREVAEIMCMHRNYDYVICPSEATGKNYCRCFDIGEEKLKFLALPRVDEILRPNTILPEEYRAKGIGAFREALCREYGIDEKSEIVLYVPTFRKGKDIELDGIKEAVKNTDFTLVVKVHPVFKDVQFTEDDYCENIIVDWKYSSYQWLSVCDRIVTDYSALGVEAALTGKPLYYYVYDIEEYRANVGLNFNPLEELPEVSALTGAELRTILYKEYDYNRLKAFRGKYVSVNTDDCTRDLGNFVAGLTE